MVHAALKYMLAEYESHGKDYRATERFNELFYKPLLIAIHKDSSEDSARNDRKYK